jgi:hypothetical protein
VSRKIKGSGKIFPLPCYPLDIIKARAGPRGSVPDLSGVSQGGRSMPKKALWLIIIFTLLFILGINTGDLDYLLNLGSTICLSCIGVG